MRHFKNETPIKSDLMRFKKHRSFTFKL